MLDRTNKQPRVEPRRPAVGREFQSPAVALEDDKPAAASLWLLFALTALLISAAVFASLASVDEIVIARGQLVTTVPTLIVQPLETVAIKAVHVKVGDIVRKGQVLASLDPTFVQADVDQLKSKVRSYSAREARLDAELARRDYVAPAMPNAAEQLEEALFLDRKSQYASRMRSYTEDVDRFTASLRSARNELKETSTSADLLRQIVSMRKKLVADAYVSKLQLIEAQNQLVSAQRSIVQLNGKIEELDHQLESAVAQRDAFAQEWRAKVADELVSVRREREAADEDLGKAQRRRDMVNLTAPKDAIVLNIAQRSVGSVLRQAEPLFTLVPLDAPLEAEVHVSPRDVGRIHDGEVVRIKLDAFPFQKHGTIKGRIKTISADTFQPQTNGGGDANGAQSAPFYKAQVTLVDTHLTDMPNGARLLPGMTATAEIKVGRRRVISYVLYPIVKGLDESMREP